MRSEDGKRLPVARATHFDTNTEKAVFVMNAQRVRRSDPLQMEKLNARKKRSCMGYGHVNKSEHLY